MSWWESNPDSTNITVWVRGYMSQYWTDAEFTEIVKNSNRILDVLEYFGLSKRGGQYYKLFHDSVKKLNLDISHFNNTKKYRAPRLLKDVLIDSGHYTSSSDLRKRLIKEGILNNVCSVCGQLPVWNNKPLTLQLDHINGINTDNRLENLRILCPHCHSQTETYCGNKKEKQTYIRICKMCGGPKKTKGSQLCDTCYTQNQKTKIVWPQPEIVFQLVTDYGFVATGNKLGVSDSAVRKFLKKNNLKIGRR